MHLCPKPQCWSIDRPMAHFFGFTNSRHPYSCTSIKKITLKNFKTPQLYFCWYFFDVPPDHHTHTQRNTKSFFSPLYSAPLPSFCALLPSTLPCSDSPASVNHFIVQTHTHVHTERERDSHKGPGRGVMKLAKCFQPGSPSCHQGDLGWRSTRSRLTLNRSVYTCCVQTHKKEV